MLQDDWLNFMGLSEPREFHYMNAEKSEIEQSVYTTFFNFSITFSLSNKVHYHRRTVYDIFHLYGDVGGFADFVTLFFGLVLVDSLIAFSKRQLSLLFSFRGKGFKTRFSLRPIQVKS